MKKYLAAVLSILAVMSIYSAAYAEEIEETAEEVIEETVEEVEQVEPYVPYDPENDPTRINPSPLDEIIRRRNQQNYNRLEADNQTSDYDDSYEEQPKEQPKSRKTQQRRQNSTNRSSSSNPFTRDNNNSIQFKNNNNRPSYSSSRQPAGNRQTSGNRQTPQNNSSSYRAAQDTNKKTARRWQTWDDVKNTWYDRKTAYQFTNWIFTPDEVTVQLVDRNGRAVKNYTIYPLEDGNPDAGYELGEPVKAGTQIVVPDGCIVQGDFRHVNRNEDPLAAASRHVVGHRPDSTVIGYDVACRRRRVTKRHSHD